MSIIVKTGIPARKQESSFMNACLQNVSQTHIMSIAVHLPNDAAAKAGIELEDHDQVAEWLGRIFASAIAEGCTVEVQVGPEDDTDDMDDSDDQ